MTPDHLSPAERSRNMAAIHSRDTGPEMKLRRALTAARLTGYRVSLQSLPGKPDIAYTRWRLAVFVDGGFWHGHPKRFAIERASEFWRAKITRNMQRDEQVNAALHDLGWSVLRYWDVDINKHVDRIVTQISVALSARGRPATRSREFENFDELILSPQPRYLSFWSH